MATQKISVEQKIAGAPEVVWFALTRVPVLNQWLCDSASVQANEGGRFYAWWNDGWYASGVFTTFKENEAVTFTWNGKDEPGESQVHIALSADGGATTLTLAHETPEGDQWKPHLAEFEKHWRLLLENLQFTVERGLDKRMFDRPFLGIMLTGIPNEETAERLGLPEHGKWIQISGTVPDTGAAAAGLQADDVLVSLGGHKTETFQDLNVALSARKAGDTVDVELYRDGALQTMPMQLSHRPQPEVPATISEAAAAIRKVNAELVAELDALFEGVDEAHAAARPAASEWSAREVLAHLIMNERWFHMYVSTAVTGQRTPGFSNDLGTIAAIAAGYDNAKETVAAYARAMETSVAALEGLPEDALKRKYDYVSLLQLPLNFNPQHTRSHYPQIEAALEAAGAKG